jgi:hypothetical protein
MIVAYTTIVVSSNPALVEVYSIQHYVIKFVSDLLQVGGFLYEKNPQADSMEKQLLLPY